MKTTHMTWFILAITPPILWAIVNHMDKFLLSKAKYHSSVNVLMVYSTGFSIVVLPILWFFSKEDLFVNIQQVIVQIIGGVLITLSIYFYLLALSKDETSNVVPFFLLTPVFGYILSYFILGEVLSNTQILSCALIVLGALILSLEFNEDDKVKIKHGVLLLVAACTFFQAVQETLFKMVTVNESIISSLFWFEMGILIYGIVLLSWNRGLFGDFLESVKVNGKTIFGVNILGEALSTSAYMIRDYAMLFVPITIVMALNGYQPAFAFIIGIIITIFLPKFGTEKIKPIHLIHKSLAISIMIFGTYIVSQTL